MPRSDLGGSVLVEVLVHDEGEWTIVTIVGELDLAAAPRVRQAVAPALADERRRTGPPAVVLDLGSVHFIDSSGLGIVLGLLRRVRQLHGTMRVVVAEPQVRGVFELLGLDALFELHPSVADAVAEPVLATAPAPGAGSGLTDG